jgi:hypothetical protein
MGERGAVPVLSFPIHGRSCSGLAASSRYWARVSGSMASRGMSRLIRQGAVPAPLMPPEG